MKEGLYGDDMVTIKKNSLIAGIAIFVVCVMVATALYIRESEGVLKDSYENDNRVVAGLISNVIEKNFLRPITVSETISKDSTTRKILNVTTPEQATAMEESATEYLKTLRDGLGYSMVFAVSEQSKAYFSCNGISKYVNPGVDPHDEWYKNFVAAGERYSLDVDTDEANNWSLSVFVNTAVYDDSNRFLGVCGVGVNMIELQKMLEKYERIYDVKINLINEDGLIQVDTDTKRIEKDTIQVDHLSDYADGECYYEMNPSGNRTITYLDSLGWYLVVQNNNTLHKQIYHILLPGGICLLFGLVLMIVNYKLGMGASKDSKNS